MIRLMRETIHQGMIQPSLDSTSWLRRRRSWLNQERTCFIWWTFPVSMFFHQILLKTVNFPFLRIFPNRTPFHVLRQHHVCIVSSKFSSLFDKSIITAWCAAFHITPTANVYHLWELAAFLGRQSSLHDVQWLTNNLITWHCLVLQNMHWPFFSVRIV